MDKAIKGSSRNRTAGHNYERECVLLLKEAGFPHVVSTRSESVSRDAQGIDIMNKDEGTNGRLPYNIQCKNYCQPVKYHEILTGMPQSLGVTNVIFSKLTSNKGKKGKTSKFVTKGHYAILSQSAFIALIKRLKNLQDLCGVMER